MPDIQEKFKLVLSLHVGIEAAEKKRDDCARRGLKLVKAGRIGQARSAEREGKRWERQAEALKAKLAAICIQYEP